MIIEPDYSYCITDFNKIVSSSAFFPELKPSFPRYFIAKYFKTKKHLSKAILFDGQVGSNYFHFFSDILNKVWLFDKIDDNSSIPIIIGERTYNTKYFQYLLANTFIKEYNWVVQQQGEYLEVDALYFIRPMPYKKAYFNKTKALFSYVNNANKDRKVFLNRSVKSGRYIENFLKSNRFF